VLDITLYSGTCLSRTKDTVVLWVFWYITCFISQVGLPPCDGLSKVSFVLDITPGLRSLS
jgi:hypothetical protein